MKRKLIIFLIVLCPMFSIGQSLLWERQFYGSIGSGYVGDIIKKTHTDTTVFISGAFSNNGFWPPFFTVFTQSGNQLWFRYGKLNGFTGEQDFVQVNDSLFLFTGSEYNTNVNTKEVYTQMVKYNGDTLISKNYANNFDYLFPTKILKESNNNYSISTYMQLNGYRYYHQYKIDSNQNIVLNKNHLKGGNTNSCDMLLNSKNQYIFNGNSDYDVFAHFNTTLLKVNSNGDSLLAKKVIITDSLNRERPYQLYNNTIETLDNSYVYSGRIDSSGVLSAFIAKVDSNFNLQWSYIDQNKHFTKVKQLADSSYLILASKKLNIADQNIYLIRINPDGTHQGTTTIVSDSCTRVIAYDFTFMSDSSIIITGLGYCNSIGKAYVARIGSVGLPAVIDTCQSYTVSFSAVQQNDTLWLTDNSVGGYSNAKTSQWNIEGTIYTGTTLAIPIAGLPDSVNITLVSTNYYGCTDSITRKQDKITNIKDNNYTQQIKLYPNPTTGIVYVQLPTTASIEIVFYNLQGQEVQKNKLKGSEQINISHLPQGIYFYHLLTESGTATGKLIKE